MLVVGLAMGWEFPSSQAWGFGGVLAGLIYGAITGAVMLRLLRQSPSSNIQARVTAH
jgi:hypothetical protein